MKSRFGEDGICKECYRRSFELMGLCDLCTDSTKAARFSRREAHKYRKPDTLQCEICGIILDTPKKLKLDHCHKNEHPRGWLCGRCNVGIGFFRDSPHTLLAAAAYLMERSDPNNPNAIFPQKIYRA